MILCVWASWRGVGGAAGNRGRRRAGKRWMKDAREAPMMRSPGRSGHVVPQNSSATCPARQRLKQRPSCLSASSTHSLSPPLLWSTTPTRKASSTPAMPLAYSLPSNLSPATVANTSSLLRIIALALISGAAIASRLFAVVNFESIIHELYV